MPQKRLSMRKIKEVLRLRFGLGLHQDQIARSCSIGQATVHRYLEKAAAAKVTWPLPEDFDDRRLDELLFPQRPLRTPSQPRPGLDFAQLHTQLQTNNHLALQLLWEEYRETQPDGYGYSRFCELRLRLDLRCRMHAVPVVRRRSVHAHTSRGKHKNKQSKKESPWWNLPQVAYSAKGNAIGAITDLKTSCLGSRPARSRESLHDRTAEGARPTQMGSRAESGGDWQDPPGS